MNGLKTLYARFSDIGMGETLEDGVDLGQVTGTLQKVGVEVLDAEGQMNSVGDIMEDLMDVWQDLNTTQKNAIATTLAGKYQLARFEALMNSQDLYEEYKAGSENADGTLDVMNEKYVNSLQGKLNILQSSVEGVMSSLFETDDFYNILDVVTKIVNAFQEVTDAIGGGQQAMTALFAILLKTDSVSKSLAQTMAMSIYNKQMKDVSQSNLLTLQQQAKNQLQGQGITSDQYLTPAANTMAGANMYASYYNEEMMSTKDAAVNQLTESVMALQSAESKLQEIEAGVNATFEQTGTGLAQLSSEGLTFEERVSQVSEALKIVQVNGEATEAPLKSLDNIIGLLKSSMQNLEEIMNTEGASEEALAGQMNNLAYSALTVSERVDKDSAAYEKLTSIAFEAGDAVDSGNISYEVAASLMSELATVTAELNTQIKTSEIAFNTTSEDLQHLTSNFILATNAAEAAGNKLETLGQLGKNTKFAQDMMQGVSAITSLVFGLQELKRVIDIINDEDLSFGDKALEIIIALTMGISMVIPGLQNLLNFLQVLGDTIITKAAATTADTVATEANTAATVKNTAATVANNAAKGKATTSTAANTASTTANTASTIAGTIAAEGFGAAIKKVANALKTLIKTNSALIGKFAAVAGVVAAVSWFVKEVVNSYNYYNDKLDEVNDSLSAQEDLMSDVNSTVEEGTELLNGYDDAVETLDNLTKGTDEWNEALKETNQQVLDLLQLFPELSQYVSRTADGQLVLSTEGEDEANKLIAERSSFASIAESTGQQSKLDAQKMASIEEFVHRGDVSGGVSASTQASNMQLVSKAIDLYNKDNSLFTQDNIQKLADALGIQNIDKAPILQDLIDNVDEIAEIANTYSSGQTVEEIAKQNAAAEWVTGENPNLANPEQVSQMVYSDAINMLNENGFLDSLLSLSDDELKKKYADYAGVDVNDESLDDISRDTMLAAVSFQEALQSCTSSLSTYDDAIDRFKDSVDSKFGDDEDTESARNALESSILSYDKDSGQFDLSNLTADVIETLGGSVNDFMGELDLSDIDIPEDVFREFGFESAEEFIEAFQQQLADTPLDMESIDIDVIGDTDEGIESRLETLDLTTDELESYKAAMLSTNETLAEFNEENEATIENLQDTIDKLTAAQKGLKKDSKEYKSLQSEIDYLNNVLEQEKNATDDIVLSQIEFEQGAEDLLDVLDDYSDLLAGDILGTNRDYIDAVNDTVSALQNFLGIDMSSWDFNTQAQFVKDNLDTIKAALDGDYEAYMKLSTAAAKKIAIEAGLDDTEFQTTLNAIIDYANSGEFAELVAGATLDDTPFLQTLTEMLVGTKRTAEEIEGIVESLAALGISADIETTEITVPEVSSSKTSAWNMTSGQFGLAQMSGTVNTLSTKQMTVVKSVKYTKTKTDSSGYTGSASNWNSGNSGSSGSSGSGSGSGSTYTPKTKDENEEELDRYEKINAQLEAIDNDISLVQKSESRLAAGTKEYTKNLAEQVTLLEKQKTLVQEKYEIAKQEQAELQSELSSKYGITFDGEGFIANYASVFTQLQNTINDLTAQYNAASTEEAQTTLEEQIDAANDKFDDFQTDYQRYDELVSSDLKEYLAQLEDIQDTIEDIYTTVMKTRISAASSLKELKETAIEVEEIFSGYSSDSPWRGMETLDKKLAAYPDYIADLQEDLTLLNQAWAEIQSQGYTDVLGYRVEDSQTILDMLEDVSSSMADALLEYESDIEDLQDKIIDGIDEMADEIERVQKGYELVTDELEHQQNIVTMLHGDNAYEQLDMLYEAQAYNYESQIASLQECLTIWKDLQQSMTEGSDEWLAIQDQINDAQTELNQLIEDSLDNLQKKYNNMVNSIVDSWFENALGTDADWAQQEWELINRNADYYLDSVEAAYNIQKLQSKYVDLLDQSNNLATQQKITQQMNEQLSYLREKDNLSEYDVAYAEAQLEILQKTIALEEAQQNKSQMKLRRDSQGNYSYVYTADTDSIADAESDLLDAQYNAYELSKEQMQQTQADSLSALVDAKSLLADIWTNANLDTAEKVERTKTIIDSLKEYLAGTSEQLSTSEQNIITDFIDMCELLTDENSSKLDDTYQEIINGNNDAFDEIDTRWSTSISEWLSNMDEFNMSMDNMFDELKANAQDYASAIDEVAASVNQNFNSMTEATNNAKTATDNMNASSASLLSQLQVQSGTITQYENSLSNYSAALQEQKQTADSALAQYEEANAALKAAEETNRTLLEDIEQQKQEIEAAKNTPVSSGDSGNSSSGNTSGGDGNPRVGDIVTFTGKYYYDSWGQTPAGSLYSGVAGGVVIDSYSASQYGGNAKQTGSYDVHIKSADGQYGDLGWVSLSQLSGYDTGGYTGDWSDGITDANNGKLAILHQKELVLNAEQTEHILEVSKIVESVVDSLKQFNLGTSLTNIASSLSTAFGANSVDQDVTINATFEDVRSSEEIKSALTSLVNEASIYANKQR
jgi:chromosome segregation ATPase